MKANRGPFPSPAAKKHWAANNLNQLFSAHSGEFTSNVIGNPIGAPKEGGKITNVAISLGGSGAVEHGSDLSIAANVYINGTTCLSTQPEIAAVSGESATHKTSRDTSDSGVTQAVIDTDARNFSPGDLITYDLVVTRTTPDSELVNPVVVVDIEPN